ncbi:hypothetical protein [Coleofasciculus sp. F4-SAH-05]|uniref:hypothetical protein n=1 Tax=Coleofasciculus TaxID=669368 RepID=UPI0032F3CC23
MNEQRRDAYLKLINALLTCPSGEEGKILPDNAELVDAGLVVRATNPGWQYPIRRITMSSEYHIKLIQ